MVEKKQFKLSKFYENKSDREQRLELIYLIETCNLIVSRSDDIGIGSSNGHISGVKLDSVSSDIKVFPEISDNFYKNICETIEKYKTELQQAKKQLEDKALNGSV